MTAEGSREINFCLTTRFMALTYFSFFFIELDTHLSQKYLYIDKEKLALIDEDSTTKTRINDTIMKKSLTIFTRLS